MIKKKVTILVPSLVGHGMERMAVLAAETLCEQYEVQIVLFTKNNLFYKTEIPIYALNLPSQGGLKKISQLIKRIIKFNRYKKVFFPDIVISFGTSANLVNVFSNKIGNKIISFRGFATVKKGIMFNYSCRIADGIVCISEEMKHELILLLPKVKDKTYTIHNGIDGDFIEKIKDEEISFAPAHPAFVSVGRLEKVKGYSQLINSFVYVLQSIPSATLNFVGSGSELENLKTLAHNLGIANNVNFLGAQTNPYSYISKCDICVQTSLTEGFMNVLIESGFCRVPVISTACKTGPKEIISGEFEQEVTNMKICKYGILVPKFSSDEAAEESKRKLLAQAMIYLAKNKNLQIQLGEALNRRSQDFSLKKYSEQINLLVSRFI